MDSTTTRRLTVAQRLQGAIKMAERKDTGKTVKQISVDTGISSKHLYALEDKYNRDPEMNDEPRSGRRKKVTTKTKSRVLWAITSNPFTSSKQVKHEVTLALPENQQISHRTVQRIARIHGIQCRRLAFKVTLTASQVAKRLEFANRYRTKDMRHWHYWIFSDEVRIELHPQDRRQKVWRPSHKRFDHRFIVRRAKVKSPSVMFWGGCINAKGQGDLVIIAGIMNGSRYAEVLSRYVPQIIRRLKIGAQSIKTTMRQRIPQELLRRRRKN